MEIHELEKELSELREKFLKICREHPQICPHEDELIKISDPFKYFGEFYREYTYKCKFCGREEKKLNKIDCKGENAYDTYRTICTFSGRS